MNKKGHRDLTSILNGCKLKRSASQRDLYDLLFDPILNVISRFHVHSGEAEDLMQETFIKVFRNLDSYDASKGEISTWACTIAKRLTINYCNSLYKRNLIYGIEGIENIQDSPSLSSEFDWDRISVALKNVPDNYKEVFELSVYQGMKHAAIADELGISESTSRVYLSRALESLRKDFKSIAS